MKKKENDLGLRIKMWVLQNRGAFKQVAAEVGVVPSYVSMVAAMKRRPGGASGQRRKAKSKAEKVLKELHRLGMPK